jgi:Tfp pilus assembly PilM family ATPase
MYRHLLGLDIGSNSIRAVVLSHDNKPPKLVSYGRVASPVPGINSESDLDLDQLSQTIKLLVLWLLNPAHAPPYSLYYF